MAFERNRGRSANVNAARDAARGRSNVGRSNFGAGQKAAIKPLEPIGGKWTEDELVAMVPELLSQLADFGDEAYAGIGSRETPEDILGLMVAIAKVMQERGYIMRSGAAIGADSAFEAGITDDSMKEIYLPKKGFEGRFDGILLSGAVYDKAQEMALQNHPNPDALFYDKKPGGRSKPKFAALAHTRNMAQVLGRNLDKKAMVILAYTPDGAASGGTGQAIRVAESLGVPVLNLRRPEIREAVMKHLGLSLDLERYKQVGLFLRKEFDARSSSKPAKSASTSKPANPSKPAKPFDFDAALAPEQRWKRSEVSTFLKAADRFGNLGNMAGGNGYWDGSVYWKSSEAQYQALRFPDHPDVQKLINEASNGFEAKKVAYEHIEKSRPDWEEVNLEAMAYVITRKRDASPFFRDDLAEATAGGKKIVEWSKKSTFWGAAPDGGDLLGQNVLGRMLNQLEDGARQDELPRGSKLIGKEAGAEVSAARDHSVSAEKGSVKYTSGDVSGDQAQVIVNTVNSQLSQYGNGVMGKGVALAFVERFGEDIKKPYAEAIRSGELVPGTSILFDLPNGQKMAALATKDHFRDPSKMEWVDKGLEDLANRMRAEGLTSVALPPPGCGNGGLSWKDVEPLVHKHLSGFDLTLYAEPTGSLEAGEFRSFENDASSKQDQTPEYEEPKFSVDMYFSYGNSKRPEVTAATTFEAILRGERTSTTRYDKWRGSAAWGRVPEGTVVRFYEEKGKKGRHVDVRIKSVERIDLRDAPQEKIEAWSKAEGWSEDYARKSARDNGPGFQIRYEPIPGQEILKERMVGKGREDDDLPMMQIMQASRQGAGR